jgi:hypothetical protein
VKILLKIDGTDSFQKEFPESYSYSEAFSEVKMAALGFLMVTGRIS